MHVLMLGLSFLATPVAIRERAALSARQLPTWLQDLVGHLPEAVILSTCNRTEVYVVCEDVEDGVRELRAFVERVTGCPALQLAEYLEIYQDQGAIDHLFRVAAGLESMVLGEGQILSQVKEAHGAALATGAAGVILDRLFRAAITAGKRVRTETEIARGAVSVSSAAVELAREAFGTLKGRTLVLLGAGKMCELAAKLLADEGLGRVIVANRTVESARQMAEKVGGEVVPWIEVAGVIGEADVVLCATGAPHYVIAANDLAPTLAERQSPVVFIDISVPRNLDPALRDLPMARLHDIDDLHAVAQRNRDERAAIVDDVLAILDEELADFQTWFRNFRLTPMITSLRGQIAAVREGELARFWGKHGESFEPEQRALVEELTVALVNKFLHQPTSELKRMPVTDQQRHAAALKALFGLKVEALGDHYRKKVDARRARCVVT